MNDELNKLIMESTPTQKKANELLEKLFEAAKPTAVFSPPVTSGDYTLITASEVTAVFGAGYGGGVGIGPGGREGEEPVSTPGGGGGGRGGGTAAARPVAAISIGPNGVHVEPIVDSTKIAMAFFTALGAIFMALGKMRHFRDTGQLS